MVAKEEIEQAFFDLPQWKQGVIIITLLLLWMIGMGLWIVSGKIGDQNEISKMSDLEKQRIYKEKLAKEEVQRVADTAKAKADAEWWSGAPTRSEFLFYSIVGGMFVFLMSSRRRLF